MNDDYMTEWFYVDDWSDWGDDPYQDCRASTSSRTRCSRHLSRLAIVTLDPIGTPKR
jgi:hypothetical protein